MTEQITHHLQEIIRDNWGMSLREIEIATGWPRRMLRQTLGEMQNRRQIYQDGARYVSR